MAPILTGPDSWSLPSRAASLTPSAASSVRWACSMLYAQLLFQFLDGDTECRLTHMAGPGGPAKVFLAGNGNNVTQFGQGHGAGLLAINNRYYCYHKLDK